MHVRNGAWVKMGSRLKCFGAPNADYNIQIFGLSICQCKILGWLYVEILKNINNFQPLLSFQGILVSIFLSQFKLFKAAWSKLFLFENLFYKQCKPQYDAVASQVPTNLMKCNQVTTWDFALLHGRTRVIKWHILQFAIRHPSNPLREIMLY